MHHLVSCPACARHVRAHEAACPFCAHALPARSSAAGAPVAVPACEPGVRLSRAKLFALGTAAALAAAACSGANTPPPEPAPGAAAAQPTATPATSPTAAAPDGSRMMLRYGAPPAPECDEV